MPRALPRPTVGLALVLGAALFAAPVLAHADPTATPSPSTSADNSKPSLSAAQTSSGSSPRATDPSSDASNGSSDASNGSSASPKPSAAEDPAGGDASHSPTGEPRERIGADAIEAPAPTPSASSTESAEVRAEAAAPAGISLTKSASRSEVSKVGQVITYRFVAKNTGAVELTNVAITDQLDGLSALDCPASTTLAPTSTLICTATLTVTQDWMDFGAVDNSATVFGTYTLPEGGGTDYVGANASAHVSVDQKPSISLQASVSPTGTADAGDRLRYAATATNTGNVTLRGARIDSSLDALDCAPSARATLAPGESITCDGSYQVTRSDGRRGKVSNVLTASASGPYDDQGVSDTVTLRTEVTKISSSSDSGLADTGASGDALPVGVLGVLALVTGAGLVRRGRRT